MERRRAAERPLTAKDAFSLDETRRMLLGCHHAGIFTLGKDESIKRVDDYGDQYFDDDYCRGDPLGFLHGERITTATYDDASASEYDGDHDHDDSDDDWVVACAARGAVT